MGSLAVQQSQSPRRKTSTATSSPESSPSSHTMARQAVYPPLNLRSTSTGSRNGNSFMPHASFLQTSDSNDDAERRNATALTIVELLARAGTNGNNSQAPLPSLRRQSSNSTGNSPLPSLPKMVIPSLRGDQRFAFPSSSGGYSTQTPTSTGVSPHAPSPPKRGRGASASGAVNNSRKRQKDELTRLLWERMAQHQKEEKSKAEMENLRLKGLIQEQLKISKGLEKLLRKRCKSSMSSGSDAETSAAVSGPPM
ncbi:M96 mating-specific protein family, partial [Phytophthora palmivora]